VAPWGAWLVVLAATGASMGLGLYHLTSRSLWLDEGYTWLNSSFKISSLWHASGDSGGHLFLYYLLLHGLTAGFGAGAFVLRIPSVVAGAALVPLGFLLTCRLAADRLAGIFAAVLLAVSSPLVFWQQNAREYVFVALLAVVSTLLLVIAVQDLSRLALIGWAVATAVACYTNPQAVLLPAAQLLPVLVWPPARTMWRPLLVVIGVAAAAAVYPLASASALASTTVQLGPPNAGAVKEAASFLASGTGSAAATTIADHALLGIMAVLWAGALVALCLDLFERGRTEENFGRGLALSWLVVPGLLSWVISETFQPIFADRYLILSLPAAAIVVAMFLARVQPRAVGIYGLVYLTVFRFGVLAPTYDKPVDDFRGATQVVLAHAQRGDCVVFYQNFERMLYDYYAVRIEHAMLHSGPLPAQVLPPATTTDNPRLVEYYDNLPPTYVAQWQTAAVIAVVPRFCPRIWLYESHAGGPTGTSILRVRYAGLRTLQSRLGTSFRLKATFRFSGVQAQLFERRAPARPPTVP
jgi:mannosyltransferase